MEYNNKRNVMEIIEAEPESVYIDVAFQYQNHDKRMTNVSGEKKKERLGLR